MPNRILREGILTSEAVCSLSWPAECFYRRLLSVVDDFGRYYANPSLLRAACYPLQIDKVGNPDIGKWAAECATAGLVRMYAVDGKEYLEVARFRQQVRAKASKFPDAPADATPPPSECVADAQHMRTKTESETNTEARPRTSARRAPAKTPLPEGFGVSERVRAWAAAKGYARLDEHLDRFISKAKSRGYTYADWDEALMTAIRDDWAGLGASQPGKVQLPYGIPMR